MPLSIDSAARRICQIGDWQVTNLQLQKILYLSHMYFMGTHQGRRLVDASFEAWDYGPVLPALYKRVAMFGSRPIQDIFRTDGDGDGWEEFTAIDKVAPALVTRPAAELVSMTHLAEGAWASHYRPGIRGLVIPDADIFNEYRTRTGTKAA